MDIALACPCCGSTNLKRHSATIAPFVAFRTMLWGPTPSFSVLCQRCGLLFLDLRYDEVQMKRLYHDYRGAEYTEQRGTFEPDYPARNEKLLQGYTHIPQVEEFLDPFTDGAVDILDYGGDIGINTPFAKEAKRLDIYDINGKKARNGNKIQYIERTYNLIVCSQVLEHTPYPDGVIKDIKWGMNKDTVLYIDVPFPQDVTLENKRIWHEHINFFSVASLSYLLEGRGIHIETLTTLDTDEGCILMLVCKL